MSYPQYPGGYNPYPAYPTGMSAPSGATAITAGVLACVGAVGELFSGGISLVFGIIGGKLGEYDTTGLFSEGWFQAWAIATGVIGLIAAVLLGVGAVAMFTRKSFGRVLVVVGSVVVIVTDIVGPVLLHSFDTSSNRLTALSSGVGSLFSLIFPIATAILALLPVTGRWLAHTPVAAQQYGYPYPGPPQPGPALPTQPGVDGRQAALGQPGPADGPVPAGQAAWQGSAPPAAGSLPAPAWQQPAAAVPIDNPSAAAQSAWGVPAHPGRSVPNQLDGPLPVSQSAWGVPAQLSQSAPDQLDGLPPAPQASWGVPAQPGPSAPDHVGGLPPVPQSSWGVPAQPSSLAPNGQVAPPSEPQVTRGAPAQPSTIGRDDETVLRPPSSVPPSAATAPQPADDTVRHQPPS
ncbi:hypothetical protein OG203_24410 [Nocardia sp. NBC_01499]|uniref:hypothetical protein n=1 Tax=Nocardia sp. NBC_01499 TaxID=2903597 RepID=UPI00386DC519